MLFSSGSPGVKGGKGESGFPGTPGAIGAPVRTFPDQNFSFHLVLHQEFGCFVASTH